eukprot:Sdes_comp20958_c0_seq1m18702
MGTSSYKEEYRKSMVVWGEEMRALHGSDYFCRLATLNISIKLWIVSDIRRESDLKYFLEEYPQRCLKIRVVADDASRILRGWKFQAGVDDGPSECSFDDCSADFWDFIFDNNGDREQFSTQFASLCQLILDQLHTDSHGKISQIEKSEESDIQK